MSSPRLTGRTSRPHALMSNPDTPAQRHVSALQDAHLDAKAAHERELLFIGLGLAAGGVTIVGVAALLARGKSEGGQSCK